MHETVSLHFEPPFHFYFLCRIWEERAFVDKIVGLINSFGQLGLQILICVPNPVDSSSFLMLRKTEGRRTEDEVVGWHHQLNGYEFEKTSGNSEGQESLVCCSPWDCRVVHSLAIEQ